MPILNILTHKQRLAYSLKYKTPVQYRTEQGFT